MKDSPNTIGDVFLCKVCEKASDGEDINKHECMDLRNDEYLNRLGKFHYLEDMPTEGGGENSASVASVLGVGKVEKHQGC